MTAWISKQSGNWTRASNNADSPWYDAGAQAALSSYPGGAGTGDTAQIGDGVTATQNITLDANPTYSLAKITNGDNTSYVTVAASRTIVLTGNPGIDCTTTNTSGFIRVTGGTFTVTHDQGAGTIAIRQATGAGYTVVASSTSALAISNSGGSAITLTSTGRVLSCTNTGNSSITGSVDQSGAGQALSIGGAATWTITGGANMSSAGTGYLIFVSAAATVNWTGDVTITTSGILLRASLGTINLIGNIAIDPGGSMFQANSSGGTVAWTGSRTLAANIDCNIGTVIGSTLDLSSLVLSCSGRFSVGKGTGTLTLGSGGTLAQIILQASTASAAILGQAHSGAIVGPTLPTEAQVESGVDFGYADALTGTLSAGGGIWMPRARQVGV